MYILLAILIFGLLIFIHELGHFLVARAFGVDILEFAIGMGPKIFSKKSKKSGIVYSIRLLPLGGFVSMAGENGMEVVQGKNVSDDEKKENSELNEEINKEENKNPFIVDNEGELERTTDQSHLYCNQSVWKRILISIAGPFMNILLGAVFTLIYILCAGESYIGTTQVAGFYIQYTSENDAIFQQGDQIYSIDDIRVATYNGFYNYIEENSETEHTIVVYRYVYENETAVGTEQVTLEHVLLTTEYLSSNFEYSLSEKSGLKLGDEVIKVNNTSVHTYNELAYEIMQQGYKPLKLTVLRDNEKIVLEEITVPTYTDSGSTFGDLDFMVYREANFDFATVMKHTFYRSISMVKMVFDSLFGLFSGRYSVEAVSGPVGITVTISEVAKTGILNVFYLISIISINLGVMNLLPIPALDGGHLLLYIVELIRRKPLNQKLEGIINAVGLIIMLILAVLIAFKDILSL